MKRRLNNDYYTFQYLPNIQDPPRKAGFNKFFFLNCCCCILNILPWCLVITISAFFLLFISLVSLLLFSSNLFRYDHLCKIQWNTTQQLQPLFNNALDCIVNYPNVTDIHYINNATLAYYKINAHLNAQLINATVHLPSLQVEDRLMFDFWVNTVNETTQYSIVDAISVIPNVTTDLRLSYFTLQSIKRCIEQNSEPINQIVVEGCGFLKDF